MEAENMVHSDSMSPASLGICEKLFRRWEVEDLPDREGSARRSQQTLTIRLGLPGPVQLPPLPADPTHHQNTAQIQIREAVPPDHAPPGITVIAHVSVEVPSRTMESPLGAPSSTPPRDSKKAGYSVLCTAVRPVGTNNSKRPIPNPKAQGSDPLVHRGELQHMAAELGSYKQAHTSSPPLTLGNSRVVEGPAPLKELGSRAQAMRGEGRQVFVWLDDEAAAAESVAGGVKGMHAVADGERERVREWEDEWKEDSGPVREWGGRERPLNPKDSLVVKQIRNRSDQIPGTDQGQHAGHLCGCVTVWEGSDGLRHLIILKHLPEDQCRSSALFVCA
ncbi:hypothetical protein L3Q82_026831 [Scortum barcoo]|uniref:Uncharacterized protein n=1 Tax=Scortum barcoo TaxID=214431 RepID=A0ACB8WJ68_9TELE|nr:hypothetical protein L3Q82_026831 [Scortum barcoo]